MTPLSRWTSIRSQHSSSIQSIILHPIKQLHAKKDLFSDDIFDDNEEESKDKIPGKEKPKKNYLGEDWQLSPTDQKEFKGFPKKDDTAVKGYSASNPSPTTDIIAELDRKSSDVDEEDDDGDVPNYPFFALVYKFRREFAESSTDAMMADHKGYSRDFKRLLSTEVLRMSDTKGVVNLWVGFSEEDKDETRAEIVQFVEEDPLIIKDAIEQWDIIDLSNDGMEETDADADLAELPAVVV